QERHADRVVARSGKLDAEGGALFREHPMGKLQQQPRSIAAARITARSTTMRKVDQDLHTLTHDLVRLLAPDMRHKTESTGIVLIAWIVHTLLRGKTGRSLGSCRHVLLSYRDKKMATRIRRGATLPAGPRTAIRALAYCLS